MLKQTSVYKTMIPASTELRDEIAIATLPALIGSYYHNKWEMVRKAYEIADAMIEVREEGQKVTS